MIIEVLCIIRSAMTHCTVQLFLLFHISVIPHSFYVNAANTQFPLQPPSSQNPAALFSLIGAAEKNEKMKHLCEFSKFQLDLRSVR